MNDKVSGAKEAEMEQIDRSEIEELQRDMRAARIADWAKRNQQALIAGAVALVIALGAAGLWIERGKTRMDAAATLYQQAQAAEADKRKTMLSRLMTDFPDTSYALMARMQLAALDAENAESYLKGVIESDDAMPEWVWQARLDLARLKLAANDPAAARQWLAEPVGKAYRQLRHYLLAQASDSPEARKTHLQKALDAESHDEELKRRIEGELAALAGGVKGS